MSRIWREDETPVDADHESATSKTFIWRDDEGTPTAAADPTDHLPPIATDLDTRAGGKVWGSRRIGSRFAGRVVLGALGLVFALAVGDVTYSLIVFRSEMIRAEAAIRGTVQELVRGQGEPTRELEVAKLAIASADASVHRPGLTLIGKLPVFREETNALIELVSTAHSMRSTALVLVRSFRDVGFGGVESGDAIFTEGRVDLNKIEQAELQVSEARVLMEQAFDGLRNTDSRIPPIAAAVDQAVETVGSAIETLSKGREVLEILPEFLGARGSREYVLAFQALGEARASGGVITMFGVLEIDRGRMKLGEIGPIDALGPTVQKPVDAPSWFEENYQSQLSLRQVQQANLSPDFPTVGSVLTSMFQHRGLEQVDGVIVLDALTLRNLLPAIGSLDLEDPYPTITSENAARVIMHDSYLKYPKEEDQSAFLNAVIRGFWSSITEQDELDTRALLSGLTRSASTGHLKLFSANQAEESVLAETTVGEGYDVEADHVQMVFNNSYGLNKVDYFLKRRIETDVRLTLTGVAKVTTSIHQRNLAPSGPPSDLIGPDSDAPAGTPPGLNRMTLNLLVSPGSRIQNWSSSESSNEVPLVYSDGNEPHPITWQVVEIEAGEQHQASVRYDMPYTIGSGNIFSMTFVPQPKVHADQLSVRLVAPDGFLLRREGTADDPKPAVTVRSELTDPQTVTVELVSV